MKNDVLCVTVLIITAGCIKHTSEQNGNSEQMYNMTWFDEPVKT